MTMEKRIAAANAVLLAQAGVRGTETMIRQMLEAACPEIRADEPR